MNNIVLKGEDIHIYYATNDEINDHVHMYFPNEPYAIYGGLSSGVSRAIYISNTIVDINVLITQLHHECLHMLHTLYNDNIMQEIHTQKEEYSVRLTTPMVNDIHSMVEQINENKDKLIEIVNENKSQIKGRR